MNGIVCEIQRFSLNDGPGIRSTVFFKGCDLRCGWCHNPETLSAGADLHFYPAKCIGCGKCFKVCPVSAHKTDESGAHYIDRTLCTSCGRCASVCWAEALAVSGRKMTVGEILGEVKQDKAYYDESGGGVTLSGGEVGCQAEFALALLGECAQSGIHTAIETNLCLSSDSYRSLLDAAELVMCDIKLFDPAEHKNYTGQDNETLFKNLEYMAASGKPVIVRTPLIPGVTDGDRNLRSIADYLDGFTNVLYWELLNFNPLGGVKYKSLGIPYGYAETRPLSAARLGGIRDSLRGRRTEIRLG